MDEPIDNEQISNPDAMDGEVTGEEAYEDSAADDDIFRNNHDLIGVKGILRAQKNEIEKKKVSMTKQ